MPQGRTASLLHDRRALHASFAVLELRGIICAALHDLSIRSRLCCPMMRQAGAARRQNAGEQCRFALLVVVSHDEQSHGDDGGNEET